MSDLFTSIIISLGCLTILLMFFFIWKKQYKELKKVALFKWVFIIGVVIIIATAIVVAVKGNDPNFDYFRKILMIATAGTCIWYGAWCSQYKMDKEEGIARKID